MELTSRSKEPAPAASAVPSFRIRRPGASPHLCKSHFCRSAARADSNWSRFYTSRDGTFDFRAVQPGMYFLNAAVPGADRVLAGRRIVEIREGDNAMVDVRVSPASDIVGHFLVEDRSVVAEVSRRYW